ncbi:MAG: D-alanyl-D-alanine carboxypeptidase [Kiritimatiellae bacterium]|nr:D-alanyl-D-alanine carboxypeptidase [Kiritimatiellia bacterium]
MTLRAAISAFAVFAAAVACAAPAKKPVSASRRAVAAPVQTAHRRSPYVGAICADATTGRVLSTDSADAEAYPASVTKLMTLFLVLEDVRAGKYDLDSRAVATPDVNRCEASWIGIKVGEAMSIRDLCLALMVESANDAAIVLAVNSAGSFDDFVARMNSRAAELGMTRTRYYNPNGLPPNSAKRYPWKSFNISTAADQLKLALAILKFPEALEFTSVKTCDLVKTKGGYRIGVTRRVNEPLRRTELAPGESIVKNLCNHNNVMVKDKQKIFNPDGREAVDGLKTGYIDAGGSSVVITGTRGGKRAVAVVLGSSSSKERDEHAARLISDALGAIAW